MTPEELADLIWKLLRKRPDPNFRGLSAGEKDAEFMVRTTDGRNLVVTV
jgi:hypothetical protein